MTKEQMKEIMREAKQDAEDKIYDDAIDGMERQFEKMKVSTSEENTITTILKMHINVNAAFGSYIEEIINNKNVDYKVKVSKEDMGKVIGRQGKVAKSIRTVMKSVSAKEGKRANIEFVD